MFFSLLFPLSPPPLNPWICLGCLVVALLVTKVLVWYTENPKNLEEEGQ